VPAQSTKILEGATDNPTRTTRQMLWFLEWAICRKEGEACGFCMEGLGKYGTMHHGVSRCDFRFSLQFVVDPQIYVIDHFASSCDSRLKFCNLAPFCLSKDIVIG
jgi:hypothetical protein